MMYALPTFMRAFNKQFHTQMKFESAFLLTTCPKLKFTLLFMQFILLLHEGKFNEQVLRFNNIALCIQVSHARSYVYFDYMSKTIKFEDKTSGTA